MKRKIFSKLLMGALLIASVSSFVSCKDYDDDINDLRSQIQGNATTLSQLVDQKIGNANTEISSLKTQLASIEKAYAAADASLQKAIDDVKNGGATTAATVQSIQSELANLAAAKVTTESAIKALQDGVKEANDAIKENSSAIAGLKDADAALTVAIASAKSEVTAALEAVKNALEKEISDNATALTGVSENLAALTSAFEAAQTKLSADIAKVNDQAQANKTAIEVINAKLATMGETDKDILAKVKDNSDLIKAIKENLDAVKAVQDATLNDIKEAGKHAAIDAIQEALREALGNEGAVQAAIDAAIAKSEAGTALLLTALEEKVADDAAKMKEAIETAYAAAIADAMEKADENLQTAIQNLKDVELNKLTVDMKTLQDLLFGTEASEETAQLAAAGLIKDVDDLKNQLKEDETGVSPLMSSILSSAQFAAAINEQVGEITFDIVNMITAINLFHNTHEWAVEAGTGWYPFDHRITFVYASEFTNTFPKKADADAMGHMFVGTDKEYTFVQGTLRTYSDSILVRVSPANANLKKATLALLDSKGNDLVASGLIEIEDVHKYTQLLTRASETGLWVVNFKLQEGTEAWDKFEKASQIEVNGVMNDIVYAVGARNTSAAAEGENGARYVVSEYDLTLANREAQHADNFNVNKSTVEKLKNRWTACEDGTRTDINVQGSATKAIHPEFAWLQYVDENNVWHNGAYTDVVVSGDNQNAGETRLEPGLNYNGDVQPNRDNRQYQNILKVQPGETISIVYGDYDGNPVNLYNGGGVSPIKGFYVTLDTEFALESAPSEYNAWTSYSYENVGYPIVNNGEYKGYVAAKMQDGNAGSIKILDTHNVKGDIIGFRVYAVNLDGTLVDPDGRAFYVYVGDDAPAEDLKVINITTTVNVPSATTVPSTATANRAHREISEGTFTETDPTYAGGYIRWFLNWGENNPEIYSTNQAAFVKPVANTLRNYNLNGGILSSNDMSIYNIFKLEFKNGNDDNVWQDFGNNTGNFMNTTTNMNEIKWYSNYNWNVLTKTTDDIRAQILQADRLIDGETYTIKASALRYRDLTSFNNWNQAAYIDTVQVINIKIKKVVPTSIPSNFKIRTNQLTDNRTLTVYVKPVDGNYVAGNPANTHPFAVNNNLWQVANKDNFNYVADVKPYDFADIFTGLTTGNESVDIWDQNYVFEVEKSDKVDPADAKSADKSIFVGYNYIPANVQTAVWGFGTAPWNAYAPAQHAYSLPAVHKAFVNDGVNKKVSISYLYRNISSTKNNDGTFNFSKDLRRTLSEVDTEKEQSAFYVTYKCALNIPGIAKMNNNQIVSTGLDAWTTYDATVAAQKAYVDAYNALFETTYETDYTLDLSKLVLNPQQIAGLKYSTAAAAGHIGIALTKNYEDADYAWATDYSYITLKDLFNQGILKRGSISLNTTDYYTGSWNNNRITLSRVRSYDQFLASDLQVDVPHTVTINVEDVFGHKYAYSFIVTMKKPAMHARHK